MKKLVMFAMVVAPVLYTPEQVSVMVADAVCKSQCKNPGGYVSGILVENRCWCANPMPPEFVNKTVRLFHMGHTTKGEL